MGYKVVVDYDLCESNAICMQVAPEVFEVRDDDFLYVLDETPGEDSRESDGINSSLSEAGYFSGRKLEKARGRVPRQARQ